MSGDSFSTLFARVDHTNNIDTTLTKTFTIKERVKLQIRAESFNLCNKPLFGAANLTATNSSFSAVTTQTNNPRYIQFGARVVF